MARTKGMLNLSGNLEVNAQAPLDARTIVPTEADLTVASNFPYPYVGLEVYVTGTGKKFRLTNLDTTQSSSWHEIGEGGGTGGGHTIQDDGVNMTARDNLNFVGFNVTDDSTNNRTTVTFPNIDLSVLSNEANILSLDEKVVGQWTDGKLLYQKTFTGTLPSSLTDNTLIEIVDFGSGKDLKRVLGFRINQSNEYYPLSYSESDVSMVVDYISMNGKVNLYGTGTRYLQGNSYDATVQYTKTTDSPLASDVKFAGVTSSGEVILKKEVTLGNLPNNSTKQVAHGITNIGRIWLGEAYGITTNKISVPLPFMNVQGNQYNIQIYVDSTNINIITASDNSAYSGYATVYYTLAS